MLKCTKDELSSIYIFRILKSDIPTITGATPSVAAPPGTGTPLGTNLSHISSYSFPSNVTTSKTSDVSVARINNNIISGGDGTNNYSNCCLAPVVYFFQVQGGYGTDVVASPNCFIIHFK